MNKCFVIGKIIEEPNFNFLFNKKKHISIVKFKFKILSNLSIIKVKAFDEKADYIYRFYSKNDYVIVEGWIDNKLEINIELIKKI